MDRREMFLDADSQLFRHAYELRNNMTETELLLWECLRKNQMGARFRAQHPILKYIADFYCHKAKLIIEVDGGIHQIQKQYDVARSNELESYGIKVLRFTNIEILKNLDEVLLRIKNELNSRLSL